DGKDNVHGHITLEHELSNSTITLAEFWLPIIQKNYQTMPATACNNIAQPYWEESFVYPIQGSVAVSTNGSATGVNAPTTGSSNGAHTSGPNRLNAIILALVATAVTAVVF
ncbi:hypothetical protein BGX21_004194, partial [Mortierella sp. AD011]